MALNISVNVFAFITSRLMCLSASALNRASSPKIKFLSNVSTIVFFSSFILKLIFPRTTSIFQFKFIRQNNFPRKEFPRTPVILSDSILYDSSSVKTIAFLYFFLIWHGHPSANSKASLQNKPKFLSVRKTIIASNASTFRIFISINTFIAKDRKTGSNYYFWRP